MRANQAIAVILLSASTAIATMWGYNHFTQKQQTYVYTSQDSSGKIPANYTKFFEDGKRSGGPVDFVDAANAAIFINAPLASKLYREGLDRWYAGDKSFSDKTETDLERATALARSFREQPTPPARERVCS